MNKTQLWKKTNLAIAKGFRWDLYCGSTYAIHISMDDFLLYLAKIIAFVCAKIVIVCTLWSSLKVLCDDRKVPMHVCGR